jgi:hypothetical protein
MRHAPRTRQATQLALTELQKGRTTLKNVLARHALSRTQFYYWRRRLKPDAPKVQPAAIDSARTAPFIRLPLPSSQTGGYRIHLNRAEITLPADFDLRRASFLIDLLR